MHAQVRSLSIEGEPIDQFCPPDPRQFGVQLAAMIGPNGGPGGEIFYLTVCTPAWLAENSLGEPNKGFAFVRHHLVVDRWSARQVEGAIDDLCRRASGPAWSDVAAVLGRYLAWEFEDPQ